MHDYHKAADFLKPAFGKYTPFCFGSPKIHTVGGPGQTGRGIKTEGILAA